MQAGDSLVHVSGLRSGSDGIAERPRDHNLLGSPCDSPGDSLVHVSGIRSGSDGIAERPRDHNLRGSPCESPGEALGSAKASKPSRNAPKRDLARKGGVLARRRASPLGMHHCRETRLM